MPAEVAKLEPPSPLKGETGSSAEAAEIYRRLTDHYRCGRLGEAWDLVAPYTALTPLSFEALHVIGTCGAATASC